MSKTVYVGLSGGVDSAVSAALLKEAGHTVVGAFIKIWQPEFTECTWREDRLDAMRVAAALSIPFKEIDLSDEYKQKVVQDMIDGYAKGETPNPDVLCNRHIKFGTFMEWARAEGADAIATGHYARVEKNGSEFKLLRGVDTGKDQSYFLWQLREAELPHILFPVGGMHKSAVRAHAERLGLPVAAKSDSQGLCFVGAVSIPEFLGRYIPLERGPVLNEEGTRVGEHDGAALYTVGQRHGFSVEGSHAQSGPYFVIRVDIKNNALIVSADHSRAARTTFAIRDAHWVGSEPALPLRASGQARYRTDAMSLTISGSESYRVETDTPIIATPGQSLVLYDGEQLLGGGSICATDA